MYNHAPSNYTCPLCLAVNGTESEETMVKQDDIFYRDDVVIALINSKFVGNNPGHAVVIPLEHFENIYDLSEQHVERIMKVTKEVALALKKIRNCDGVTILQNNEPAGGQHALHFHMHVFPRFTDDRLHENMSNAKVSAPEERKPYSTAMREYFSHITIS